jgi:hypothetical protein
MTTAVTSERELADLIERLDTYRTSDARGLCREAAVALIRLAAKPSDEVREATIEKCAKIAEPWPGFWLDENSTDVDRAVVAVRTEIAKTIRALSTTGEPKP